MKGIRRRAREQKARKRDAALERWQKAREHHE